MKTHESWGRYYNYQHTIREMNWHTDDLPLQDNDPSALPYGLGRSYGDSCLNDGGILIDVVGMNRFLAFDEENGILRCEGGVSLKEILDFVVSKGWFLSVTPGTKFVTVGGAIANDVHGKNHHRAGNFGHHVLQFELLRSDGTRLLCSPTENEDYFRATIGGMGLTGMITWADIKLKPVNSPYIEMEMIKFRNLTEFFELSAESELFFEHTVSWIDCLAQGSSLGQGLFTRGNHATPPFKHPPNEKDGQLLSAPIDAPDFALNNLTVRLFNLAYYNQQFSRLTRKVVHYNPFFYPLDSIGNWNRIYGKRGFMQYQFVMPFENDEQPIRSILSRIAESGMGTFLVVLKTFGDVPPVGLMSFPRKGVTLALDFPNQGEVTLALFDELDRIVTDNGGILYPAKDSRMSAESFQRFYPQWREFSQYIDPKFSSSFWRRVTQPVYQ